MMSEFHWFWAWEDEKEEDWLREMANRGRHLQKIAFPGIYTFEQGTPRNDVYRLDFNTRRHDKPNYLQVFHDAGWEHVEEYGSWQYFRKEAPPGEAPEIFTDNASKVQKYQRIMLLLVALSPIWLGLVSRLNQREEIVFQVAAFIGFLLILLYIYALLMLLRRIGRLKRRNDR